MDIGDFRTHRESHRHGLCAPRNCLFLWDNTKNRVGTPFKKWAERVKNRCGPGMSRSDPLICGADCRHSPAPHD